MSEPVTIDHIAEMMAELRAYQGRTIVVKIGGNSIAEDELFLSKIARQILFLSTNGVRVVLVHGGGPQIDDVLQAKNIITHKGKDGRRITSPAAMRVVAQVMKKMNQSVAEALIDAGCRSDGILIAAKQATPLVTAESIDAANPMTNRSGFPTKVMVAPIERALQAGKIVVLHSLAVGPDGKSLFNVNGDDYAMAVATAIKAKRLILVTNVAGVMDRDRQRIAMIDGPLAAQLIDEGVISGGMVPKVESALSVIKQGVGGVAIIDGFHPWALLAELMTHQGLGTLFQSHIG